MSEGIRKCRAQGNGIERRSVAGMPVPLQVEAREQEDHTSLTTAALTS